MKASETLCEVGMEQRRRAAAMESSGIDEINLRRNGRRQPTQPPNPFPSFFIDSIKTKKKANSSCAVEWKRTREYENSKRVK